MSALCVDIVTPDFDPWYSDDPDEQSFAKRMCATCLVSATCLAGARKRGEVWGIYAGVDFRQREAARLTAEMAAGVLEVAEVHDRSRYVRGCRCGVCTAANTTWKAEYERLRAFRPVVVTEPETIDLQMELFEGVTA